MGSAAVDDAVARLRSGGMVLVAGWSDGVGAVVVASGHERDWFEANTLGYVAVETAGQHAGRLVARPSPESAAAELLRMSGRSGGGLGILPPVQTTVSSDAVLPRFADDEKLVLIEVDDLVHYLWCNVQLVEANGSAPVPTRFGTFDGQVFTSLVDGLEHIAFVTGDVAGDSVVTRVHSECLTGDVFGSLRCDCGAQLEMALEHIAELGRGVVIYVRGHEGRGIGLAEKFGAYRLQDDGLDTVEANLKLGHPVDARHYGVAAQIISLLGIDSVVLLTNNPEKVAGLVDLGVEVAGRSALWTKPTAQNLHYLETKRSRLGHVPPEVP